VGGLRVIGCAASLALVGACQSGGGTREQLDPQSGITWLSESDPVVYARTETRYSRSARDYIYLGPVETNRRGTREYFLWVGIATTLDRGYFAPAIEAPNVLFVRVRGDLLELELRPWVERVPDLRDVSVYRPRVQLLDQLAARVSLDQLVLLSSEPIEVVRTRSGEGRTREYFRWEGDSGWPSFLARAGGGADSR
jgi:hypothetical protein